jgi:hypothetical protein
VGGHMLGAWAGHVVAALDAPPDVQGRPLTMRRVPLAVVMVALTTLTLWSLGQAIVVSPPPNADVPSIPIAPAGGQAVATNLG